MFPGKRLFFLLALILILAAGSFNLQGCNSGGDEIIITLLVGDIIGPSSVDENSTSQFGTYATGDTGISYQWGVSPPDAGDFSSPTESSTDFTVGEISSDISAEITVVVTSDESGPIIKKTSVSIFNLEGLRILSIEGPSSIDEYETGSFEISVWGDEGITYEWVCVPDDSGTFDQTTTDQVEFTPSYVDDDLDIQIFVVIMSDQYGPHARTSELTITDHPQPTWLATFGGPGSLMGEDLISYGTGGVILAGEMDDLVDLDPGPGVEEYLAYHGGVVAQFDVTGDLIWADVIPSSDGLHVFGVATGAKKQIVLTGYAYNGWPPGLSKFLRSYPRAGVEEDWYQIGDGESGRAVAINSSDRIIVTGQFIGEVNFGGVGGKLLTSNGQRDGFITIQGPQGHMKNAFSFGGSLDDFGLDIALDQADNIYTIGYFTDSADLNPGEGVNTYNGAGGTDCLLIKLSPVGEFVWARAWGGPEDDSASSIVIDSIGNIYVVGEFRDSFTIADLGATYVSNGGKDAFLIKFLPTGQITFCKTWGGILAEDVREIALTPGGDLLIIGDFRDIVDFDPGLGEMLLNTHGYKDVFLMKLSSDGEYLWARTWGGELTDKGSALYSDDEGNIFVTGTFTGTADLDPGPAEVGYTAQSGGGTDTFLMKLTPDGLLYPG